ncbi:signal transduction histidine kinase [Geodermatophilus bullaregiensis]|uniref:PAS domain-containing sensor histidine kinase n=1 Tax=Geodermatophilus bullaregiensis TaxID=1564160 RepID=UPI0019593FD8|nr:ATP-binding protein [Geodermatophilus bullaregiensis]MBM7806879.1 signal transduction histidine kinase [Geodermatophilus bullaregiensis]
MTAAPGRGLPDRLAALSALADQVPDLTVCVFDAAHRFVLCHGPWLTRRGLTAGDVLGRTVREVVLSSFADDVDALVGAALAGRPQQAEFVVDYAEVSGAPTAVWEMAAAPLAGPDGAPAVLLTCRDVVRARASDAALSSSEQRFRTAFDAAPTPMALLVGAAARPVAVSRVNAALVRLTGRAAADLLGRDLAATAVADGLVGAELADLVERALHGQTDLVVDTWLRHADGTRVPVSAASSPPVPATAPDGTVRTELVLMLRDTTAELATHRALTEALAGERRAAEHQRRLETLRGDFVAAVSHELRTPMTGILGNIEVLLDGDAGALNPMQALMLATVEREAQRLRRLIEDLLTTAHIESGAPSAPEDAEVDLAAVAEAAAADVAGQLTRRRQRLVPALTGPAWVRGDAAGLRGVVAELLSNAATVSPAGAAVRLSCTRDGGDVVLAVADSGPGIPDAELPYVFERFFRTAHAGEQALPGTGLGLSLVAHTVTAHGGAVAAESGPGGAVFTVRLPASAAAAAVPHLLGSPA